MEKSKRDYDFAGYATKFGVKCSDGVTIGKDAFKAQNGKVVPMVWMHNHNDMSLVIGHAELENREDGVYAYGKLNDSDKGQLAKKLVKNGDITALSIYANKLKRQNSTVIHGEIKEVSLVLAGANPEAYIETIVHSGIEFNEENFEANIYTNEDAEEFVLHGEINETEDENQSNENETQDDTQNESTNDNVVEHADEKTLGDVIDSMNDKQKFAAYVWITAALQQAGVDTEEAGALLDNMLEKVNENQELSQNETIQDIVDTYSEEQRNAVEALIGLVLPDDEDTVQQSENENQNTEDNIQHNEEENVMKNNVFDQANNNENKDVLTHDEFTAIMNDAKRNGSVKDAFIAHGITDVTNLFPESQLIGEKPATINNDVEYVAGVLASVKKSPFARVKTIAVDITGDNARAKGYVKGNQKVEEVISALKRTTDPQTVYKLQKMDRDDVIDITDFDVIAYLKTEMRGKLDEELARAILTGDGRSASSPDKINPLHIRPILGDNATYVTANIAAASTDADPETASAKDAKAFIKKVRRARKNYKGTGKPTLYISNTLLDELLLIEDKNERFIYTSEEELARTLRVAKIVGVEYFDEVSRLSQDEQTEYTLQAIMVNLTDYTLGANKGGQVTMFEDFDINFNKQEYLIETRVSGALTKPFAAVTFELSKAATSETPEE